MPIHDFYNSVFTPSFLAENFTQEEQELCSFIYERAKEEVDRLCDDIDIDEGDAGFEETIEATIHNLNEIIRLFTEAGKARRKYLKVYPRWKPKRKNNIRQLKELADQINKDRRNCNISTITGASVSGVGGVAVVACIAIPPVAPVVGVVGSALAILGGGVTFGTAVTQTTLLVKCMKKAKHVLDEDQKEFEVMGGWFRHSQDLIDIIEKIIGFNILKEISNDLKKISGGGMQSFSLENFRLKYLIKKCVDQMVKNTALAPIAIMLFLIPTVVTFFFTMVLLRKSNSLVFNSVVLSHHTALGLMKILDVGGDAGVLLCNLVMKGAPGGAEAVSKATAKMVARGAFAVFGIALDVANIAVAAVDIHNGSKSKHADDLKSAATKLKRECDLLKTIYNELHSNGNN